MCMMKEVEWYFCSIFRYWLRYCGFCIELFLIYVLKYEILCRFRMLIFDEYWVFLIKLLILIMCEFYRKSVDIV